MYVMNCTRLNIAYFISKHSQVTSNHNMDHWQILKMILKYSRYTLDYGLHYTSYPAVLKVCSDTN
jgi:hypothetical protein